MRIQALIVLCLPLLLAACAGEPIVPAGFGGTMTIAAAASPQGVALPAAGGLPKKTMSDKVLTAIALERVTGLKPDPGRLTD